MRSGRSCIKGVYVYEGNRRIGTNETGTTTDSWLVDKPAGVLAGCQLSCINLSESLKNVRIEDRDVTAPVIELGELYLIKRSGSYKHRLYALGNQMREGDYFSIVHWTSLRRIFVAQRIISSGG